VVEYLAPGSAERRELTAVLEGGGGGGGSTAAGMHPNPGILNPKP